ncbi:MAG: hypothetical protein E7487_04835 [Ruminococcaceae bacterium]|nr:hypothetical protein [Oscillospiraceae bacterium]
MISRPRKFTKFCTFLLALFLTLSACTTVPSENEVSLPNFISNPTYGTQYYVSSDGNDTNDGTSPESAIQTLERAMQLSLNPGDAILLRCGDVWSETFAPTVSGEPDSPLFLGSYGEGSRPALVGSSATLPSDWCIMGISFSGMTAPAVSGSGRIHFVNCDFSDTASAAIALSGASDSYIINCLFYDTFVGIATAASQKLYVTNCDFRSTGDAAIIIDSSEITLNSCTVTNSGISSQNTSAAALVLNNSKVTLQQVHVSASSDYAGIGGGAAVASNNSQLILSACEFVENTGPAFSANGGKLIASDCIFRDNNTNMVGGNVAFSVSDAQATLSGGSLQLHNDAQLYDDVILKKTGIISASGEILKGDPDTAIISSLKAGTGIADITPTEEAIIGTLSDRTNPFYQYMLCDPAEDILDNSYIRVLLLEDSNGTRLLLLSCDILYLEEGNQIPENTRRQWADLIGTVPENVIWVPNHTHQGIAKLEEGHLANVEKAINDAVATLTPVKLGVGYGQSDLGSNRRPYLDPNPELPFDNTLTCLRFTRVDNGTDFAVLVHYPIHNTAVGYNVSHYSETLDLLSKNSSELTGLAMQEIENQRDYPAFYFNGFSGNITPNFNGSGWAEYETVKQYAKQFADTSLAVIDNIATHCVPGTLAASSSVKTGANHIALFSAFSLGDIGFFGISAETFYEIGSSIVALSPFETTLTSGLTVCGVEYSYAPSYAAFHDGLDGYEVLEASKFNDEAEALFVSSASEMLAQLSGTAVPAARSVSVISSTGVQQPEAACDGDIFTACIPQSGHFSITFDLGETVDLSRTTLSFGTFLRSDIASNYQIWVSDTPDFTTSTLIACESGNSVPIKGYAVPHAARYLRFVSLDHDETIPALYEFAVYQ